jgi:hypothetical protein
MSELRHLVQDLRANAHRCPEDLRPLIRQAATELELRSFNSDAAVLPPPFSPPHEKETTCA